ncbi:DUF1501 domain-containing protein [Brevirhabdus sp.]|uniref:DUF1501 domain-containing protein n=1 Tax=Brevirhabdus sp. TaxID=2004514 RepID=UPI004058D2F4
MGMDRRGFLKTSALLGCSAAAHPLLTTMSLASAPTENRLVVMVLRGAMDGLDVVQPYGDGDLDFLRPTLSVGPGGGRAVDLDGFYALNAGFGELLPLWKKGELAFAHAVSTPYRDGRSHFDGQDMLEAGTSPEITGALARQGWLNRMLQVVPGMQTATAFAVGRDRMRILTGEAPVLNWAPDTRLEMTEASRRLLSEVYHEDALFMQSAEEAIELAASLGGGGGTGGAGGYAAGMQAIRQMTAGSKTDGDADVLARFAAQRLLADTRIAAFSINGWDTHKRQSRSMLRQGAKLSEAILMLRRELGLVWEKTTVLAMTEFGRTARENGSQGTDHGTGGVMVMAGGALAGAKVHGRWPGLGDGDLLDGRDLMPTQDVRAYAAWAMRAMYGLSRAELEATVFPGLDMGDDPHILA